jgi:tetratricopeptide (TPR) repeat protein
MTAFLRRLSMAVLLSLACVGALARDAVAQQTKNLAAIAGEYVAKGLEAQSAGRFDEAIGFYNQAYALLPHPLLLFNLGQAYRLKGDRVVALDYYRKYVAIEPNGRASKEAVEWTAQIERSMQEEAAAAARKFEQERMAEQARKAEEARRSEEAKQAEDARKAKQAEDARVAAQPPAKNSQFRLEGTLTDEGSSRLSTKRKLALGCAGVSLVSLSAAIFFDVKARRRNEDYLNTPPPESRREEVRDDANSKRGVAKGLAIASGALLATGVVLWVTGASPRSKSVARGARTVPLLTRDVAGFAILGDF